MAHCDEWNGLGSPLICLSCFLKQQADAGDPVGCCRLDAAALKAVKRADVTTGQ
jgi:hypothetical protein